MFGSPAIETKVGNQSRPEMMPFSTLPAGHLAGPANDASHAEAAFQRRALGAGEGGLPAIWPGKVLRAVVGGEHYNGVLLEVVVFQVLHYAADDVVELRHRGFLDRP